MSELTTGNRLLAASGGLIAGVGLALITISLTRWHFGPRYPASPFFATAIAALIILSLLRRSAAEAQAARAAATAAMWTSTALLMLGAFASTLDTHQVGYKTQMIEELMRLRDFQGAFFQDSGRYAATIPPAENASITHSVSLTSNGWSARVAHAQLEERCAIFIGSTAAPPAVNEGEPTCGPPPLRAAHFGGLLLIGAGMLLTRMAQRKPLSDHLP